jgi:hypothetical protein
MKRLAIALLLATPAYGQTYDPTLIQPVILGAPTTMTSLGLGDDRTAKVDLGFDFPYYDQTFSSAWVSSNGFISFQSADHLCCNGQPISQAPRNTIYGFWTDLISTTSPFIKKTETSFLVGWYGTAEYGTQNKETFEIALFSNGNIQFDYGNLALSYHNATAGMTGPTWDDNVQLFYGSNPSGLRNQSGLLTFVPPVKAVDCTINPRDPSCPPEMVAPVQAITTSTISTIQEAYAADVQADSAALAAATPEPVQEIAVTEVIPVTESISQQVAVAISAPERLSPEQVAALSAIQTATNESNAASFAMAATQAATSSSAPASSSNTNSPTSPTSQANTLEALNMSNNATPAASQPMTDQKADNGVTDSFGATEASQAFTAYTQVSLQDRPDFYAVRDIYRNRRLRDANFEMYRMSQTNNALWKEMVDAQYGQ